MERAFSYIGATLLGIALLVLALIVGTSLHEVHVTFGKSHAVGQSLGTVPPTTNYVQEPTCSSHAQCAWLEASTSAMPSLYLEFEAACEDNLPNGRYYIPTHDEINWYANNARSELDCPPGSATGSYSTGYVQEPTCYAQSECPWFKAGPIDLAQLYIEYEATCEPRYQDGRVPIPTHVQLNWFYENSTTTDRCPLL